MTDREVPLLAWLPWTFTTARPPPKVGLPPGRMLLFSVARLPLAVAVMALPLVLTVPLA